MASTSARAPLLKQAQTYEMEGIVGKRRDAPYRSGEGDWIKVKTRPGGKPTRIRGELFEKKW
jgi:ATP-dependent DNA ligase